MTSALHARHSFPRRLVAERIMSGSGLSPSPIPAQWCSVTPPTAQAAMAVVAVAAVVSAGSRLRSDLRRKDLPVGGACRDVGRCGEIWGDMGRYGKDLPAGGACRRQGREGGMEQCTVKTAEQRRVQRSACPLERRSEDKNASSAF